MTYQKMEDKKIYLVGPMTGLPNCNRESFWSAERILKKRGYKTIISPAYETDGLNYESYYMAIGFLRVKESDCLIALDGWEYSTGARREILAAFEQNKSVYMFVEKDNGIIVLEELIDSIFEKKIELTLPICCEKRPTFYVNEYGQYHTINLFCEECGKHKEVTLSRRYINFAKIQLSKIELINSWKEAHGDNHA